MRNLIMSASEKGKKFHRLKKQAAIWSDLSCSVERCIKYCKCVFLPFLARFRHCQVRHPLF